ncbi:hypothetical protein [Myroides indicus]|uniref:Uncharacterized protein n=1 Tax=Myroides indicus TaxID=1323422 RepID=A0A4R7ENZ9_9FLAO|nr:hypothetical protein [Myroides indicus]TDS53335.1 hypothetical protein C8P70_12830 [Myroides indicus]
MEFNKELASKITLKVKEKNILLTFNDGATKIMEIGELIDVAIWSENHKLLVTLKNGQVRLYHDLINFEII